MLSKFYVVLGENEGKLQRYVIEQLEKLYPNENALGLSYRITSEGRSFGIIRFTQQHDTWCYVGDLSFEQQRYIANTIKRRHISYCHKL